METKIKRSATDSASFTKTERRKNAGDKIAGQVRQDDLTNAEKRGECFAPSVAKRVLDNKPGFGEPKKGGIDYQGNKGHGTLSSNDSTAPLPEDGVKLNIHGRRRNEHVIGRSAKDKNDDSTVYGEDRFEENKDPRDISARGKKK